MIGVVIEKVFSAHDGQDAGSAYGVGRIDGSGGSDGASYVLLPMSSLGLDMTVLERDCIPVPSGVDAHSALLAPPLAAALAVWDKLHLEIGEMAVYTAGVPFSDLVGQVGLWRGACPVLRLGAEREDPPRGVTALRAGPEDETLDQLRTLISRKPGFAAVDFSGRPEVVDRLLEVLPRWGRLMVAGRPTERFTIDFYNNVHRKGAEVLCDVFDPSHALGRPQDHTVQSYFDQAYRILQNPNMAAVCRSATPCLSW